MSRTFAGNASSYASRLVGEIRKIPRELWPVVAAHWSEERAFRTMADYLENLSASCGQLDESRGLDDLANYRSLRGKYDRRKATLNTSTMHGFRPVASISLSRARATGSIWMRRKSSPRQFTDS